MSEEVCIGQSDAASSNLALALFEHCKDGIVLTDHSGRIVMANKAFEHTVGFAGQASWDRMSLMPSLGITDEGIRHEVWDVLRSKGHWSGEIWSWRKSGEVHPEWLSISAIRDAQGDITHFLSILTDISSEKQLQRIHQLAFYDQLTGLPNRSFLEDKLKRIFTSAYRLDHKCALLCIDLDQFKSINDSLGHAVGDVLLQEIAVRLRQCVREGDTVARLGGDEFAIVLPALSHHQQEAVQAAVAVAEKISATLLQPFVTADYKIVITPSIGIAISPDDAQVPGELLRKADTAMHHAKTLGRNNYQFYAERMNVAAQERLSIEHELRKALEDDAFYLHYQPQVMSDGHLAGVEALLRWRGGQVQTARFIEIAEETGLITTLGFWVLKQACAQMRAWEEAGLSEMIPRVAVNVSPRQFSQPSFVEGVVEILEQTGLDPAMLELELTEGCLVHDIESTSAKLKQLKAKGIRISIDDFGTGYSSLSYLKHFPLDNLKIDRSFVQDIPDDPNGSAITTTIILMSLSLGLGVIAEGVESKGQLEFLQSYGCSCYQGYLFSQAVSADGLEDLLIQCGGKLMPCCC